jgi:lipopolysaccharide/colanic/teichoic acid biosynthesis glycosyltransferase
MSAENGTSLPTPKGIWLASLANQRGLLAIDAEPDGVIEIESDAPSVAPAAAPAAHRVQPEASAAPANAGFAEPALSRDALHDALPQDDFLHCLQREKRRAERAGSALSVVIYRSRRKAAVHERLVGQQERLLELLQRAKRETDLLGYLEDSSIAVLCPGTDEPGTKEFIRRMHVLAQDLPFTASAATYPDQLLEDLAHETRAAPDFEALLRNEGALGTTHGYALKRAVDIAGALLAMVMFAPLMAVIALAIAATSRGPVIFRQIRLGKNGLPFVFYKFRSMRCGVDDSVHRQFVADLISGQAPTGGTTKPLYKMRADPRVTPIGRWIRKLSIDELPQLFNVLKGDMSLVGPRPPLPYEAAHYQPWHLRRILALQPGITGLWQVEGRSRVTFDEMVRMDLRYINRCSLAMDLRILLKTIVVVARCEGAT